MKVETVAADLSTPSGVSALLEHVGDRPVSLGFHDYAVVRRLRMTFTKITTAGAGTMGSQVAWQMAFHGKHVVVYDAIPAGLEKGKAFHQDYAKHFIKWIAWASMSCTTSRS